MTYINKLILIYQFSNQDFISSTDYNNLCTVIANAKVPPQGKRFLLFKHDQMKMGTKFVLTIDRLQPTFIWRANGWTFYSAWHFPNSFARKTNRGTIPSSHDTWPIAKHVLTRSVVVINLSRYLQHLIWTSDILLKSFNHLITFIILTRSHKQPHPTLQIMRHTSFLPGQFPGLTGHMTGRLAALVTQTPSIAVPLAVMDSPSNQQNNRQFPLI